MMVWKLYDACAQPTPLQFEVQFGFRFRGSWTQLLLRPGTDTCWVNPSTHMRAPKLNYYVGKYQRCMVSNCAGGGGALA